jgi:crossover junction endodeoxyribonuclease RuvC
MSVIMGIDPGAVSAAWGMIGVNEAMADDVPVAGKMVDGRAFSRLVAELEPDFAVVERVGAFPGQGISSAFRFGQGYGILLGVLASHGVEIRDVAPGLWKKHFRLDSDKEKARALAIKRFPLVDLGRKRDAGRAEALLMALWGLETGL